MGKLFEDDRYKRKSMYLSTHYFHLLYFLESCKVKNSDIQKLFNSHLHQLVIHQLFSDNDIILLLNSPYFDINYKYNRHDYKHYLLKSIKNDKCKKNIHLSNIEKYCLYDKKIENRQRFNEYYEKKIKNNIYVNDDDEISCDSSIEFERRRGIELHHSSESEYESDVDTYSVSSNLIGHNTDFSIGENNSRRRENMNIQLLQETVNTNNITNNINNTNNIDNTNNENNNEDDEEMNEFKRMLHIDDAPGVIYKIEHDIDENDNISDNEDEDNKYLFNYFSSTYHVEYKKYDDCNLLLTACMKKMDKLVVHLLTYYDYLINDINYTNKNDKNALLICCEKSLCESSKLLLSHKNININIFNKKNEHLLEICCKNNLTNQALQILQHDQFKKWYKEYKKARKIEKGCKEEEDEEKSNIENLFFSMIPKKKVKNDKEDINIYKNDMIEKSFCYACKNNMIEVVNQILEDYKLNVDYLNVTQNNPLYWCAFHKMEVPLLKLLKYKNIDYNIKEQGQKLGFFELVCNHSLESIAFEILKKKNIDFKNNSDGSSPFYYACKSGMVKVALKILELTDYKITFHHKLNEHSLQHACKKNMDQVIKHILNCSNITSQYINNCSYKGETSFLLCCKNKNEKRALQILKLKNEKYLDINISYTNHEKKCALYYAIKHKLNNLLHILLNDKIYYTPYIDKMFELLSFDDNEKYKNMIEEYKKNSHNCNICYECNEDSNYVVKCENCVGIYHVKCLHKYLRSSHSERCPHCRKDAKFYLYK